MTCALQNMSEQHISDGEIVCAQMTRMCRNLKLTSKVHQLLLELRRRLTPPAGELSHECTKSSVNIDRQSRLKLSLRDRKVLHEKTAAALVMKGLGKLV